MAESEAKRTQLLAEHERLNGLSEPGKAEDVPDLEKKLDAAKKLQEAKDQIGSDSRDTLNEERTGLNGVVDGTGDEVKGLQASADGLGKQIEVKETDAKILSAGGEPDSGARVAEE